MSKFFLNRQGVLLALLSLILLLSDRGGFISPFKDLVRSPITIIEARIFEEFQNWRSAIGSLKRANRQEWEVLEGKIRQLAIDQNDLSACREENEKLRKLLSMPLPKKWQFIEARAVGVVNGVMKIDEGKTAGVQKGMIVISEGILLGKVVEVSGEAAQVSLPVNPQSKILVTVKKPASSGIQARGILSSTSGKLILDRVLQGEDIAKGDLVVTSGEEGWLPELLIGQVETVSGEKAQVYKRATVTPLLDYAKIRIVFLIKS